MYIWNLQNCLSKMMGNEHPVNVDHTTEIILIFLLCQRYCCTYKVLNQDWLCFSTLKKSFDKKS